MGLTPTLSLYLGRRFLNGFAGILGGILVVVYVVDVIEMLRRVATREGVDLPLVLQMSALKMPFIIQEMLPFAVLFGGMFTFIRLTRSSELVVVRAAGVSVWQFLAPALLVALAVGIFKIALLNPLASAAYGRFLALEDQYLHGAGNVFALDQNGLWLRQAGADQDTRLIIHAAGIDGPDMTLDQVLVLMYEGEDRFVGRLDAERAVLEPGQWRLENVTLSTPEAESRQLPVFELPTEIDPGQLRDSFAAPDQVSFWDLPRYIEVLEATGFSSLDHRLHWLSLLADPLLCAAMVLMAAIFSMRPARRGGLALVIGAAILISFLTYFLSDVLFALGQSATIPAVLAAWTPAGFVVLLGVTTLLHMEDG